MKLLISSLLLVCSSTIGVADAKQYYLREPGESKCNKAPNKEGCYKATDEHGDPCEWCEAGAIPSECMSAEQAQVLPPGVFDCAAPGVSSYLFNQKLFSVQKQEPAVSDLCDDSSKSLSGYMEVKGSNYDEKDENKHLFYWMFEKRGGSDENTPFIVWLTGGPGCSSTLALLTENGPCRVNKDGSGTSVNEFSWTEAANVLWLDQPAGVGFSYGSETDTNEEMISEDAYFFLQAFFQSYPQYSRNPLFIVGESYGGHYAPAIAHRVWRGNKSLAPNTIKLNLAGLGVGNGLTDPENQYPSYVDMVTNNSHHIKIVDDQAADAMRAVVPKCTALIHQCNSGNSIVNTFACQAAFTLCNAGLTSPYQMTGLNPYDIRIKCEHRPLCYDFSHVKTWLNDKAVRKSLNVDESHSHSWTSCNFGINMKFHTDWMKDFSGYVADLINDDIPTLIYAGDVDFICNYLGNKAWTEALEWKGSAKFQEAQDQDWEGKGLAKSALTFTYLQVYDAGHMVPADQPSVALDMIKEFVTKNAGFSHGQSASS